MEVSGGSVVKTRTIYLLSTASGTFVECHSPILDMFVHICHILVHSLEFTGVRL